MKFKPQLSLVRAKDGRFPPGQVPFFGGTAPGEWRPTDSLVVPQALLEIY